MSLELNDDNRNIIEKIFKMNAENGKMNEEQFKDLLEKINFKLDEEVIQKLISKLFKNRTNINFEQFLTIFELDLEEYTPLDIKNAFRLFAKDDDKFISLDEIKNILTDDLNLNETQTIFMMNQLMNYSDTQGEKLNYVSLLKAFNIINEQ